MTVSNHESPQVVQTNSKDSLDKRGVFRYGAVLPAAAILTVGLTLTMAALVATEFTPQEKTETASYEINPLEDDLPDPIRRLELDPLREVEVPPPPPKLAVAKSDAVKEPIIEITGKEIIFKKADLDIDTKFDLQPIDKDPTPLVRIPPTFPSRFLQGDVSGYCRVRFDVNPKGQPFNVTATICTSNQLKSPTVRSVQKWKYAPKIQNGRPVSRSGLETTIRFDLKDERGEVLPLPSGY